MASPQKNNPPPTTTCDDGNSCVICFEHIDLESKAIIKNCTHIFCFTCIKSWMATTNTCPLCKQTIDVLQHSFTSDESFQEEKVEAPNLKHGDSSGGGQSNVEDQLQCLDHAFFIGEVQRLLNDAERRHRTLWQEAQSHRGLAMFEQQQLGTVESVVAELRNHKRKLQALLQFDPHATLQDLYRLQDLLQGSWGMPAVTHTRARSPVRYGADDADAAADLSDEDDFAEEMQNLVALFLLLLVSFNVVSSQGTWNLPVKSKTAYLAAPGGWAGNPNSIASYWLAIYAQNWINNRTDILPDVAINITFRDHATNGGNPGQTLLDAVDLVKDINATGFLGGAYTNDQQVIQYVATALKGMPHTCGFSSGALLSNKALYPTFVRLPLSDSSSIIALVNFCLRQGWKRIAAVITDSDYGTGNKEDLYNYAVAAGIDVFIVTVNTGTNDCTAQTTAIKNSGNRIIVPLLQYREGYIFMWFANQAGLVGEGYVYLLTMYMILNIGHYEDQHVVGYNLTEIIPYFEGAVGFLPQGGIGPLYDELYSNWQANPDILPIPTSMVIPYSWYMFDAVLTYAYAIDNVLQKGIEFEQISHSMLVNEMFNLTFNGSTGPVRFVLGDNQGAINIYQYSKASPKGTIIGKYDSETHQFAINTPITYYGGTTITPEDSTFVCPCENGGNCNANRTCVCVGRFSGKNCEVAATYRAYNAAVSEGLGALVGLCVIFAFFSAIVLAVKWDHFTGHGPFYCGIIIVGVLVSYVAALTILPRPTDALCIAFPWFLGIGFNMVYGCLFIKTWVLYGAFRKAAKMEKTNLTPFHILKVLSVFILIEVVLMIVWTVVDPPKAEYVKMLDDSYYYTCNNKHNTFWIIFLSYKGAWLVFGSVLSFLTRSMAKEYNESKSIAYAIYNDVALLIIAIPLAIVLKDIPSGDLIIEVAMIVLAFTFTMFILFFPIWWKIFYAHLDTIAGVQGTNSTSAMTKTTSRSSNNSSNSSNSGSGQGNSRSTTATVYAV